MTGPGSIPDTTKMTEKERVARTLQGLMDKGGNYIRAQEAQGQAAFVNSEQLPVDGTLGKEEEWAKIGITCAPPAEGDIFRGATLPTGWKKVRTDHSMWSHIVDNRGNVRAAIFYKAAFYDRSSFIRMDRRYTYTRDYDAPDDLARWLVTDVSAAEPLYVVEFGVPSRSEDRRKHYDRVREIEEEHGTAGGCRKWLEEHYPDYADPTAYWEEGTDG